MSGRGTPWRAAAAAAMLLVAAAPAGPDGGPGGYHLRLPIVPEGGARVQRVSLPAAVLATLQTADGHDLRVFDARGRAMPIARGVVSAARRDHRLVPMPILGAPDALRVSSVSFRLDGRGAAQVVDVRGTPVATGTAPVLLGVLLDARGVEGRAERLRVDADLPEAQPVTLAVEASDDLRTWRSIGKATLYRRPGEASRTRAVPLDGSTLTQGYLRIGWTAGSRLLAPVAIRGAVLETEGGGAAATTIIAAQAPAPTGGRLIDFTVPFATQIAGIRIALRRGDGIVPVRILGRDNREQPWALLGQGLASDSAARIVALGGSTPRTVRIEADPASEGFATAPAIDLVTPRRDILFLASGTAPFTLAAGRADARDAFLDRRALTEGQGEAGVAQLWAPRPAPLILGAPDDATVSTRNIVLWGVLLAATALLAGIAWRLWRQRPPEPDATPDG